MAVLMVTDQLTDLVESIDGQITFERVPTCVGGRAWAPRVTVRLRTGHAFACTRATLSLCEADVTRWLRQIGA